MVRSTFMAWYYCVSFVQPHSKVDSLCWTELEFQSQLADKTRIIITNHKNHFNQLAAQLSPQSFHASLDIIKIVFFNISQYPV